MGDEGQSGEDSDPYSLGQEENVASEEDSDPYSLHEEEDSEEVLLREIEEEEAREEALRAAAIAEAKARSEPLEPGSQLTDFQEQIITTGSGVGKAMLIMLILGFIVKSIEHCISYVKRKRALAKVKAAISTTKSRSVDEYNDMNPNFDRLEYVQYNAEFRAGSEMDEKIRQGTMDKRVLVQLLQQRAIELLHRRAVLMTNEMSLTRAYKMDMLPLEVWNDFQAAKESLQKEIKTVQYLSHTLGVNFQKLMDAAAMKIKKTRNKGSLLRNNLYKKKQALQNKRTPKKVQQAQKTKQQSSKSGRQSSKSSASPEPTTSAGRAAAKGLRRRRKR